MVMDTIFELCGNIANEKYHIGRTFIVKKSRLNFVERSATAASRIGHQVRLSYMIIRFHTV